MGNFFYRIFNFSAKHRILTLLILTCIIAVSAWFGSKLKLSEDISKILPASEKIDNLNFVYDNSKFLDKVVFNISFEDSTIIEPDILEIAASRLVDSIESKFMNDVVQSIDLAPRQEEMLEVYNIVLQNIPIFLSEADYIELDKKLTKRQIQQTLESNYRTLISPASFATKRMISSDPFHIAPMALKKFSSLNTDNDFVTYGDFFISPDSRNLVFLITPVSTNNTSANSKLFEEIDQLIISITSDIDKQINIEYFGSAVVAMGNADRIKKDIFLTVSIAVILLLLIISIFFRSKRTFIIVFLPVIFGALISVAVIYLLVGEVSAISLAIGAVLLGICVDFSLHVYSNFREYGSIKSIFKNLTTPILLSSMTTASAFLSLYFINSEALNDLGLFAAISIVSAALFSLLVLPGLLGKHKKVPRDSKNIIDRLANYQFSKNKYLKLSVVVLTIILYYFSKQVGFDADMMKSNYMSKELRETENKINAVTNLSKKTIYIVTPGTSVEEAMSNNQNTAGSINKLIDNDVIQSAAIVNNVFPSKTEQEIAINRWDKFWSQRYDSLIINVSETSSEIGFSKNAFRSFYNLIDKKYKPVSLKDVTLLNELFLENFVIETDTLSALINVVKVNNSEEDIDLVYSTFNNNNLAWVIDKRLIASEFVKILQDNFKKLLIISLSLVFIILLIAYGRIELTIITMIPIIISWVWTVGIMGMFGIEFNIFNVIILTFIFGLGIDYSIFIMRGLLLNYKFGTSGIRSYKVSVILSGITTLVGVGVLIFARHPALKSIASMSIIGILSVIFITFTLLPAIFRWLVYYKKGKRNRPITLVDFIFSLWALFVFVSGSIFLSLLSIFFIIVPIKKSLKKELVHRLFRYLTWFMIYMNFMSRKVILNPLGEDYRKPAIIIANHQSHVDLMLMMLLNWRVVVLTNPRNFRNPIYGPALRFAGFIEVDGDFESMVSNVRQQSNEGYSVVVFPEGHRSEGDKLRRFHKGAFQLASELDLEILPIIIYGQKEGLKKSEFFLKRASSITRFLPRINLKDGTYGDNPKDQARNVKKYFEAEYFKVARQLETPDYFNDFIKKNYLYKGPVLEWYTRVKLKLENNYNIFNDIIPAEARITDLGCGYGYLAMMLNLVSKNRTIDGYDYDEDKIAVANNCAIRADNVNFHTADITEINLNESDIFILNDVLHYMPEQLQINMINRCCTKLSNNGKVIIRDADKDKEKRHLGTRITEFMSTNIGFNKTKFDLEFISSADIENIANKNNMNLEIIDITRHTSNLIYILTKKENGIEL